MLAVELAANPRFGFDPASQMYWVVPALVLVPLLVAAFIVSGVRTRRGAASAGMFGVTLLAIGVAYSWLAFTRARTSFQVSGQWLSYQVSSVGQAELQNLLIETGLRLDKPALLAIAGLVATALIVIGWARRLPAAEPGQVRMHALLSLLLFSAIGVVLSTELFEILFFWGLAGFISYLLLVNRWGSQVAPSWPSLAAPALPDLLLLAGVGVLYSRYGEFDLQRLVPALHHVPGWGLRSLTGAVIAIYAAGLGRGVGFPLQRWTGALRLVQGPSSALLMAVWPVMAAMLVYRIGPVAAQAGPQARPALELLGLGLAAVALFQALLAADARRLLSLPAAAAVALGLTAMAAAPGLGLLLVITATPLRAAAVIGSTALEEVFKGHDLVLLGEGFKRLPRTTLALWVTAAGTVAAGAVAVAALPAGRVQLAAGAGLVGLGYVAVRAPLALTFNRLRKRRAFETSRVREPAPGLVTAFLLLALLGVVAVAAAAVPGWLPRATGLAGAAVGRLPVPALAGLAGMVMSFTVHILNPGWNGELQAGWRSAALGAWNRAQAVWSAGIRAAAARSEVAGTPAPVAVIPAALAELGGFRASGRLAVVAPVAVAVIGIALGVVAGRWR